jgi:hypothetical protein
MKEYAEDGIHVGHVIVDGAIAGDKIFKRFPDAASREESLISIEAIVNAFAFLYGQPPRGWSFEVFSRNPESNQWFKLLLLLVFSFWCPWPESNQHSLRNSILSRARLPVPPQGPSVAGRRGRCGEAGGI